ncbi:MAG: hypothetical protein COX07_06095 [Bacteroidetes bacterium CG23_combo_of_CG06-09_8_20_14_all_32_9]|nr:MAG: hypothetical protein COX07_06095 [Bacteroidetes bacterium CG23_combo_of_CG06-09_8_20_14_all_32_9]
MKKILFFISSLFLCSFASIGQNNDLLWVSQFTGTGQNIPSKVISDAFGNIYTIGSFSLTVSQGAFTLTSAGGNDAFIAKYNKSGQILWLKQISGVSTETGVKIALSNDGNYIYISVLSNSNLCNFDGNSIPGTGGFDIFIAKYAVDGTYQWAHNSAYGAKNQTNGAMTIDNDGNIILAGGFLTDVTFYGGVTNLISPALTNQKFISKFDGNGTLIWAKMLVDNNSLTAITAISANASGYYFGGQWLDSLYLDIDTLINVSNRDMFLYKTDSGGTGQWVRKIIGTADDYLKRLKSDTLGFQFLTGYYSSPTLTADSTETLTSVQTFPNTGSNDIFYACYALDGTLQFAKKYGSAGNDRGLGISVNSDHVIIGGQYTGSINFETFNLINSGPDAFMVETDRNGTVLSAKRAYGTSTDFAKSAIIDANNTNIFMGEFVSDTLRIDGKKLPNANTGIRDIFIAKFGKITTSFAVTNVLCNGDSTGAIDFTVTGNGTPPYTYLWSNAEITEDIDSLAAGWYKVTVTDANLATKVDSAQVTEPNVISLIFAVTNTSCPASTNGTINLTPVGGTSPYTYMWNDAITTEDRTALAAGWYIVTVTDVNSCSKVDSAQVLNPGAMLLTSVITTPTCVPGGDGAIDLTVFNGAGSYTYVWSNLAVTQDISSLVSGTYSVTVTDANLCTVTGSYDVINPSAPQVMSSVTGLTCVPGNDGAIDVLVSGGTTPYAYVWNDGPTTPDRTGLSAGSYAVTVTDAASCSATTAAIVLSEPTPPSISFVNTNPTCVPGNDGAIDLIVYSGNPPYAYNWTGGLTIEDISSLSEGTYTVTVTDSKVCTVIDSTTITPQVPTATITPNGTTTFCQGQNVILQATIGGGNTYQWQESGTDIAGAVTSAYTATTSGNYTVIVNNLNGCADTSAVTVVTVNPLPDVYNVTGGGSYCSGGTGVSVGLFSSDLGVNYELFLNSVTTTNILAGTGIALDFGLQTTAGTYTIIATDSVTSCTATMNSSAIVDTVIPLTASLNIHSLIIFCASINNGEATVTAQNGLQPYIYAWSASGSTGSYANDLGIGINYVTVTDGCGTSVIDSVVITSLPAMSANITSSSPTNCSSDSTGSATVSVTGGIAPYSFTWSGSASITSTANDLNVGMHYVTISDYCSSIIDSVNISSLPALAVSITSLSQVSCTGGSNGSAVAIATNGFGTFAYSWSTSEVNDTAIALVDGWNYVTVTDVCGSFIDSVLISTATPLSILITSPTPTSCAGGNNGGATVVAYNGVTPITYLWSTNSAFSDTLNTNAFATNLINDTNYVKVTDACTSLVASVYISFLPPLTASINFWVSASCLNKPDGKARVDVSNGTGAYTFAWSNSASTVYIATDLLPGWNYVTVTDECTTVVDSVNIGVNTPLSATITFTSPAACATDSNGTAVVTPLNGGLPYTYVWSASTSTDSSATDLPVGNHFVTVTDACGSLVVPVTISNTPLVTANISKENVKCFSQSNGKIVVTPINGVMPYSYVWGDTTLTDSLRTNLTAGLYHITVTDHCGSYVDSVSINQPGALSLSTIQTNVSFTGLTDGAIDVIMSGGIQPYSYLWSNSITTEDLTNIAQGTYFLTITDDNGCAITDSISIITESWHIEIYKAFTPNGDGKNDVWNIKYISAFPNCTVNIFNEWGIQVFESTGYTTAWDGTNNKGNKLPAATYYYIIDLKDGSKVYTGSVALIK